MGSRSLLLDIGQPNNRNSHPRTAQPDTSGRGSTHLCRGLSLRAMETFFETRFVGECLHITILALFLTRCIRNRPGMQGKQLADLFALWYHPLDKSAEYVSDPASRYWPATITQSFPNCPAWHVGIAPNLYYRLCSGPQGSCCNSEAATCANVFTEHGCNQAAFLILESAGKTRHAVDCSTPPDKSLLGTLCTRDVRRYSWIGTFPQYNLHGSSIHLR